MRKTCESKLFDHCWSKTGGGLGSSTFLVFSGVGKPLFDRPLLVGGGPCYFLNEEEELSMKSIFDDNLGLRKILSKVNLLG